MHKKIRHQINQIFVKIISTSDQPERNDVKLKQVDRRSQSRYHIGVK